MQITVLLNADYSCNHWSQWSVTHKLGRPWCLHI